MSIIDKTEIVERKHLLPIKKEQRVYVAIHCNIFMYNAHVLIRLLMLKHQKQYINIGMLNKVY